MRVLNCPFQKKIISQIVHHAGFLFSTTPKLTKFLKMFILQINTTRADFVSQGMNHAEGMMTKCYAKGTGLQNIFEEGT